MHRLIAVVTLCVLAGCLDSGNQKTLSADAAPPITVSRELTTWTGTCPCPTMLVSLGESLDADSWVEVRVRWDGTKTSNLDLSVVAPDGAVSDGVRGYDARRVQIWGAGSATYELQLNGVGAYEADVRIKSIEPEAGADLIPNLTTTVPVDIRIGTCDAVERTEQGATRCLRLGNAVANPGYGPIQVYLSYPEGALSLGGQGHFVQEILRADGSVRQRIVSPAEFHVSHQHWHYDGLAEFSLFAVDEKGLRGEMVSMHKKAGFCFLDWDKLMEEETKTANGGYAESDCFIPLTKGWSNGVSAGWYDLYESHLTDQYVDIAGVPDGLYEYVSVADPLNSLEELDLTDNAASALIFISGSSVKILEGRGWYHVQPIDDPDS